MRSAKTVEKMKEMDRIFKTFPKLPSLFNRAFALDDLDYVSSLHFGGLDLSALTSAGPEVCLRRARRV